MLKRYATLCFATTPSSLSKFRNQNSQYQFMVLLEQNFQGMEKSNDSPINDIMQIEK